jgi:hypothetical protein
MPFKTKEEAKAYYAKYYQTVRIPKNKEKKLIESVIDSDEEDEEPEEEEEEQKRITDTYNEPIHTPFTFQRQHHQPTFYFQNQPQVTNSIRFV